MKITHNTFLILVNPAQTQTTFKFFSHFKVLYHWIEDSISRIAQTTTFLRIIHPVQHPENDQVVLKLRTYFYHWIEDSTLTYFTESFSENLIEPRVLGQTWIHTYIYIYRNYGIQDSIFSDKHFVESLNPESHICFKHNNNMRFKIQDFKIFFVWES